jgi:putative ABC transport system permease protein
MRAGTILRGRYLDAGAAYQLLKPDEVIDGLLQNIFRIKHVIDGVIVIVGLATGLAVLLVFLLSMRLRQREIETITRIGCSRCAVLQLLVAEVLIFMLLSAVIVMATVAIVDVYASDLVRLLIIN